MSCVFAPPAALGTQLVDAHVQCAAFRRDLALLLLRHLVREARQAVVELPAKPRDVRLLDLEIAERALELLVREPAQVFFFGRHLLLLTASRPGGNRPSGGAAPGGERESRCRATVEDRSSVRYGLGTPVRA